MLIMPGRFSASGHFHVFYSDLNPLTGLTIAALMA
jgi:hypothetical protein